MRVPARIGSSVLVGAQVDAHGDQRLCIPTDRDLVPATAGVDLQLVAAVAAVQPDAGVQAVDVDRRSVGAHADAVGPVAAVHFDGVELAVGGPAPGGAEIDVGLAQ